MSETYVQGDRFATIETPLGKDVLLLEAFRGRDELSRPFHYELDLLSEADEIAPERIVGQRVTFSIDLGDGESRPFDGFVKRFVGGAYEAARLRRYRAEVVPWLWFLTKTSDCRIFQNKTVPQIVEEIFDELGFHDYEINCDQAAHVERVYCVQYRESDFVFLSRLLEEEGIFYFFRHEKRRHVLVLADEKRAYRFCQERNVEFSAGSLVPNHIGSWEHQYEFRSGKWAQSDYNFEIPTTDLKTMTSSIVKLPGIDKFEHYDYPGAYGASSSGNFLTKLRMEEEEAGYETVRAAGTCRSLFAGGKFTLVSHPSAAEKGKTYVITAIEHHAQNPAILNSDGTGVNEYRNSFTCIPDRIAFRPARATPKPVIRGVQTAVVVGPPGEEIYTDKYGCIKVQFHWDRLGTRDDKSSCWIRVAQTIAGRGWGANILPRIGQEVVVAFLEGDPDRPLIVGSVYNADQVPPYDLPANKTQSGLKSRSSKGGGGANFNEIRLEDKAGVEQLYMHAERNMDTVVEKNETHDVGVDRAKKIGRDEQTTIGQNRTETVGHNETIAVGANRIETVGANETISIALTRTEAVGVNEAVVIGGAREHTIGGAELLTVGLARKKVVGVNESAEIGSNRSVDVGKNDSTKVGSNRSVSVGENLTLEVGKNRMQSIGADDSLSVSKNLTITAGDQITIKTGSASIVMKKNGDITISGKQITIKGTGDVIVKGKKILEN